MLDGYQSIFATSLSWNKCILMYTQKFPEIILPFVKLKKAFSMIAIDQTHKQNITVIKGDRGAIGTIEDQYKAFFLSLSINTSKPQGGFQLPSANGG